MSKDIQGIKMKTKCEIIQETVDYYATHERAIINSKCKYYHQGNMCAVGRCCIDAVYMEEYHSGVPACDLDLEILLQAEYRGHDLKFWMNLQALHDGNAYWDGYKLSLRGESYVKNLLDRYEGK